MKLYWIMAAFLASGCIWAALVFMGIHVSIEENAQDEQQHKAERALHD